MPKHLATVVSTGLLAAVAVVGGAGLADAGQPNDPTRQPAPSRLMMSNEPSVIKSNEQVRAQLARVMAEMMSHPKVRRQMRALMNGMTATGMSGPMMSGPMMSRHHGRGRDGLPRTAPTTTGHRMTAASVAGR